jgi:uncharacterized lipoprotein YmbA
VRVLRASAAALALLVLAAVLSGCDTTRDKSQRAQIFADRSLATRKPVVVKQAFPKIKVEQVQTVGRGKERLIVVRLTNTSSAAFAAIPINVTSGGKLLNRGPNIPYFDNHVPAIAGKATTVWILRPKKKPGGGKLRAVVGAPDPKASAGKTLPKLEAQNVDITDGGVLGDVKNKSGTPQYYVAVYVTTRSHGRYTSAASGAVVKLSGSGTRPFHLNLSGKISDIKPQTSLGPAVLVKTP